MSAPPSSAKPATSTKHRSLLAAAIFALACIPFLPAISAGFSDFDDVGFLLEVEQWRGLGPENLAWMFSTMHLGHYQPLTYLSYAVEYSLFGLDPRIFHATNILLHAANAALVFLLIVRLLQLTLSGLGERTLLIGAAAAAVLWAIHPLRVESVAWITERRDVLSVFFLLLATLAYLSSARTGSAALGSRRWYGASIALLLLSLFAKAWGITFVAIAILIDIYPLRRLRPRDRLSPGNRAVLLQKLPFAVLSIIFAVIAFRSTRAAENTLQEWGFLERMAQACYGLMFYIWKTLAPTNLSPLYELPDAIAWRQPRWAIAFVFVLAVVAIAFALRKRLPGIPAALAAYAILIAPVLGIAQAGIQLVADRYSYLATMPLFVLAAAGITLGLPRATRPATRSLAAAALLIAVVLAALSWNQSALWGDTLKQWQTALAHGHDGATMRNYYARQLEKAGRPAEAIIHYRASLEMRPNYADSWFGLGNASKALGDFTGAEAGFTKAAALEPDPTRAHIALGLLYIMQLERPHDALAAFQQAVEACERAGNPGRTGRPYLMLAAAYDETGDEAQSVRWLREAAKWPDTREQALDLLRDFGASP